MAMNRDMPCEPIEVQPQRDIFIGTLKIPEETKNNRDALDDFRQKITYELESYDILPLMHDQDQRLQVLLSLRNNAYLKLRWNKFVESGSRGCVQLRLYRDYKMDLMKLVSLLRFCLNFINILAFNDRKPLARRKSLTGNFFGADNKLAPVPLPSKQTKLDELHKCKEESSKA
uniref:Uncharacterized protein n=1 Tax=Glossina pallidipes TaxID=7398 RepID=A0A1A9Z9P8_GLOPL